MFVNCDAAHLYSKELPQNYANIMCDDMKAGVLKYPSAHHKANGNNIEATCKANGGHNDGTNNRGRGDDRTPLAKHHEGTQGQ